MTTPSVRRVFAFRKWFGRWLPARFARRYGWFYVWRRVAVGRLLDLARAGRAPVFTAMTVAEAVAQTPRARVVELEPATTTPFPLPRVHTTRRWLLEAHPPPTAISWPPMRVLDLPNGVVLTHEGVVGPNPDSLVTDLGFLHRIEVRELFRRCGLAQERGREHLSGTTVSMLQLYPSNHAHNLVQGVSRLELFRRTIDFDDVDRVLMNASAPRVTREAIARVGFGPDRVVEVPDDTPTLVCERLLAAPCLPQASGMPPWALEFVRSQFGAGSGASSPTRLFVVRGSGNARGVVNEHEVSELLAARGFTALSMDGLTLDAQAAAFAAADVIVGVHGAALANLAFARPGTHVVELVGANTLNWVFSPLSWAAGLEHDIVVGVEPTPARGWWTWQRDADQIVDVARLALLVDRILNEAG